MFVATYLGDIPKILAINPGLSYAIVSLKRPLPLKLCRAPCKKLTQHPMIPRFPTRRIPWREWHELPVCVARQPLVAQTDATGAMDGVAPVLVLCVTDELYRTHRLVVGGNCAVTEEP